ncbi:MAG: tetraacyldisaccharide 4'-kinase [Alphaproteobacteria bacterium]|nr:tetraacyldisaccharide 4'-kinase [Alphaproteobacteria bacterium]
MRTPSFWKTNNLTTTLLAPFSQIYGYITQYRIKNTTPYQSSTYVICVGNITAGGVGKTPISIALAKKYKQEGKKVFFLTRGYKGKLKNILVDLNKHTPAQTGDEARLLAQTAPTIISPNRKDGAKLAEKLGAEIIIMDDGFQNPSLKKDESILVFDGSYGIGNGKIIPSGPLRETLETGLKRATSVIIMGEDKTNLKSQITIPCYQGTIIPDVLELDNKNVLAFAGIGHPQKFYETLQKLGYNLIKTKDFEDHHTYTTDELNDLKKYAEENNAYLITTEKDYVKIPKEYHKDIYCLKIKATWK